MRIKDLLVLIGVFAFCVCAKAQNIRVVEDASRIQSVSLNGKAEAVFVASSDNLFIETSRPSLDGQKSVKKATLNNGNMYLSYSFKHKKGRHLHVLSLLLRRAAPTRLLSKRASFCLTKGIISSWKR